MPATSTAIQEKPRRKITYVPSNELPKDGYVRKPTVLKIFGVSNTTWHNWIKEGKAPKGILLSPRCRAWRVEDIRGLIDKIGGKAEAAPADGEERAV